MSSTPPQPSNLHPQTRVPHLRDSFIVAKVGIREANCILPLRLMNFTTPI